MKRARKKAALVKAYRLGEAGGAVDRLIEEGKIRLREDGSYEVNVKASDFGFQHGLYNVHVYAVDDLGNPILVGGTGQSIS